MQIEQINLRDRLKQVRHTFDAQLAEVLVSRSELSQAQIGKQFGISQKVIRRVMKQFSIGARKRGPKRTQQMLNPECS
jgi:predicted transcriptional regulator